MTNFDGFEEAGREFQRLARQFGGTADEWDDAVDAGVEKTALQVERTAKRLVPVSEGRREPGGTLRASIGHARVDVAKYLVGTNVHYAPYVEYGRGPVEAQEADALRFWIDGDVMFRESVGPAKPQPFLRPALGKHRNDLVDNIEEEIEKLMEDHF